MKRRVIALGVLLLTVAAVGGMWAYFEYMAPVVPGTIADKQQRIIGGRHAAPGRYLSTSFKLRDETEERKYEYGSPLVTDIPVEEATYDAVAVGSAVSVKYLPFDPRMARLADQPLVPRAFWMFVAAFALTLVALLFKRTRLFVAICVGLTAAVLAATPGPPSARVAFTAAATMAALALVSAVVRRAAPALLVWVWAIATVLLVAWPRIADVTSPARTADAEVREVTEFVMPQGSRSPRIMTTLQGFDRILATFVPDGTKQAVFLLDFVDHGSVANLAPGSRVIVTYRAANPHGARLEQGSRTHYWKNAAVPVGAMLGLAWISTRERRSRKQSRTKAQAEPGS